MVLITHSGHARGQPYWATHAVETGFPTRAVQPNLRAVRTFQPRTLSPVRHPGFQTDTGQTPPTKLLYGGD